MSNDYMYGDQYIAQDIRDADVGGGEMSNYFNLRTKLEKTKYNKQSLINTHASDTKTSNTRMQQPNVMQGYPEDVLRGDQYGIPVNLEPRSTNPYIMEDIAKTQRLAPIRGGSVESRSGRIVEQRAIDGHYDGPCTRCNGKSSDAVVIRIDSTVFKFLLLILVVLVAMMGKSMYDRVMAQHQHAVPVAQQ